ncbi:MULTISPECIES: hypothetical protein [Nocardiopsis]|uniref:Uncharacterized protein n=1 Tax=Nocardiopsis changdeensis TaxID=2831969 RepID=A0ABX8BVW5_9ACTN|nr:MULTISPECIES: hypothetical protein [Nocardiopsis]QUX26370.1 hypothetical protein KGD84_32230 [Nocardiopsis changdeensis]QYX40810.1 hypothetical protein K1J57_32945 [Nocardiopsis sp. MT53]
MSRIRPRPTTLSQTPAPESDWSDFDEPEVLWPAPGSKDHHLFAEFDTPAPAPARPAPTPEIVRLQTEIAWAQRNQDLLSSALDATLSLLQMCLYRIEVLEAQPQIQERCPEPRGHSISLGKQVDELEAELAGLRVDDVLVSATA